MKYIGNKTKLISWINEVLEKENIELKDKIILDGFLGTGSFSKNAIKKGAKKIYGYEILKSMCLYAKYNVLGVYEDEFNEIKNVLKNKSSNISYFYKYFSTSSKRNYFSDYNAKKIDVVLSKWDSLNDRQKGLFIDMVDRVSNTSGTYGSFLKVWRSMALKKIEDYSNTNIADNIPNNVLFICNKSIEKFNKNVDIAYLDPPYNTRQYGSYYHVLERIVDKNNDISSKSGVLKSDSSSFFSKKNEHKCRIENLIKKINANIIIISYSNEGLITQNEWKEILNKYNYKLYKNKYKRFKTNSITNSKTKNNENLEELLFIIWKD